jgi:hypothetical protein
MLQRAPFVAVQDTDRVIVSRRRSSHTTELVISHLVGFSPPASFEVKIVGLGGLMLGFVTAVADG